MAFERERIIGMLEDILDGDGSGRMAPLVDCPDCGRPLALAVDRAARVLHARCPQDPPHFIWQSDFTVLPPWFDRYAQLNT